MKIISLRLQNFKSIEDTEFLNVDPNINVIAGKNNVGKTALLEAIYLFVSGKRLKKSKALKITNERLPKLELIIECSSEEVQEITKRLGSSEENMYLHLYMELLGENVFLKDVLCATQKSLVRIGWMEGRSDYLAISEPYNIEHLSLDYLVSEKVFDELIDLLKRDLIYIESYRRAPKSSKLELCYELDINASNLHSYFYTLHNNNEKSFDRIQSAFKNIFNDIEQLQTRLLPEGSTGVFIRFQNSETTIPLHECGSGYTHVLIILALLYNEKNKIILLDEPHLYLHPSAEKAVYDYVSSLRKHQLFFTTHSPILINYPVAKTTHLVSKNEGVSKYALIDSVQIILEEIGVANSDFALADKVLFVEGETEEKLIPMILNKFDMRQIGYNYKVLYMRGTGNEFSKKRSMVNNSKKFKMILNQLGHSPIPFKILIDRDEKDEMKLKELSYAYGEHLLVLGCREIENYFLYEPQALYDCMKERARNGQNEKSTAVMSVEGITEFVKQCYEDIADRKLFPKDVRQSHKDIVGSEVLERLYTMNGLYYRKVADGETIGRWLLEKNPNILLPIAEMLRPFIQTSNSM